MYLGAKLMVGWLTCFKLTVDLLKLTCLKLISMVKRFKYRYYILGNMCSDNVPNSMVPYGFSI